MWLKSVRANLNKKRGKRGSISYPILLISGAIFLGGLFFMVDMPLKLILSNEMVDTVNNATASAVTYIDENQVSRGTLAIKEEEAKKAIYETFEEAYDLKLIQNESGTSFELTDASKLAKAPIIGEDLIVYITQKNREASDTWEAVVTMPNGEEVVMKETSVVVYANLSFKSLTRKADEGMQLARVAANEVRFPEYVEPEI